MTMTFVKTKDHIGMAISALVDIPADEAFDVLADFSCHPRVFRFCTRMDPISTPDVGVASVKESAAPAHSLPHRARVADDTVLEASKEGNTRGRADRIQVGSKYRTEFVLDGRRSYSSESTITRVDADPERKYYEIAWAATLGPCALTTTQTVHRAEPEQHKQQHRHATNGDGRCHVTFSYALVPNNWRGRIYLWSHGKQMRKDVARSFQLDIKDICAEAKRRKEKIVVSIQSSDGKVL